MKFFFILALPLLLALGNGCATHRHEKDNQSLAPVEVPPDSSTNSNAAGM